MRTPSVKLVPPPRPPGTLDRPRLTAALDGALDRRLTLVIGGAGAGKSTLLSEWATTRGAAWYAVDPDDASVDRLARGLVDALRTRAPDLHVDREFGLAGHRGDDPPADGDPTATAADDAGARARAVAALVAEALEHGLADDLALVLDDVHELAGTPAARFVEALAREAPPTLHVVLASRDDPPFPVERLRGEGQVLELTGRDLALDETEATAVLAAALGADAAALGPPVRRATGGWPAAVRLAAEALRTVDPPGRPAAVAALGRPEGRLEAYLVAEVLRDEPPAVRHLLRAVAELDRFSAGVAAAVGVPDADAVVARLARRALLVAPTGAEGWWTLPDVVRDVVRRRLPLDDAQRRAVLAAAAAYCADHGHLEAAARALAELGDAAAIARLLDAPAAAALVQREPLAVVAIAARTPLDLLSPAAVALVGQARQVTGDWAGALACFALLGDGPRPAAVAWRAGMIQYLRGHLDEAATAFDSAALDGRDPPADEARVLAWRATVHWLRADADRCRADADRAMALAEGTGDDGALAAAWTARGFGHALSGDRAAEDACTVHALAHAERAGDLLQVVRIRANRGGHMVLAGHYEEALAELAAALPLADVAGFAEFRALALVNRGMALLRLGRLDEAVGTLRESAALYEQAGSRTVSYATLYLGDVHRERGELAQARAVYEDTIATAEASGDQQALVPALAGLARVLAEDEPATATALVERAVATGGMGQVNALVAGGVVALARGDLAAATDWAARARTAAGAFSDRRGLAEALVLAAVAGDAPEAGRGHLAEARAISERLGDGLGVARAVLALARITPDPAERRHCAAEAQTLLRALGARGLAEAAGRLAAAPDRAVRLRVQTLGRFALWRDGVAVPATDWQSRKARDLFKILLARRGRPLARDVLMELLWPDEDPTKLSNRLSVALSTLRAILDPDKAEPADRYVVAERGGVRLDLDAIDLDVERFVADARVGLAAYADDDTAAAREPLAAAEALYRGDFLEEDVYESWAGELRDEARATYVEVTRVLADDAMESGDDGAAVRYLLRILALDRFDEVAHLDLVRALVAARRHGEARRAYGAYTARMREVGVEPAPFPAARRRPSPSTAPAAA